MGLFGQYANVYSSVQQTIYSRTRPGNNKYGPGSTELVSGLKPWIRISSAVHNGLIVGTGISLDASFDNLYGNDKTSGKIGNDFSGNSVTETSTVFARGYRPSPVIETIGIENGSEGLTRKLTFQIKCFSLPQLDTITKYFLEPRFYLLAEWGWNTTDGYGSMAKIENTNVENAVCEMIQYMNLGVLKKKRSDSKGHYDAFLGVIAGGSVDFGDDETYIVNVEVMTQGEIPAYLQQHKGVPESITTDGSVAKSSITFNISEIENAQSNSDTLGIALFMYMFNELPSQKQIQSVKNLMNVTTQEVSNSGVKIDSTFLQDFPTEKYWCQQWQFINMNSSYRDTLREKLSQGASIAVGDKTYTYNGEEPLLSDARFIRMELAWRILNEIGKEGILREAYSCNGNSVNVPNHTISIDDTIIRGHKHMFSINREFLYIPNALAPDFGLEAILKDPSGGSTALGFLVVENGILKTKNVLMNKTPTTYQFPRGLNLKEAGVTLAEEYDDSYRIIDKAANSWGYLKDLYINFDFFIQCMNRNGALIKDVAIDILNGLSQGCNMFWDFQIVEIGSTNSTDTGLQKLVVVDANFAGLPSGGKLVNGVVKALQILSLQMIGANSPILESSMELKLTGAMANQVMTQRGELLSDGTDVEKSSATVEDKVEDFTGLFAMGLVDNLTKKINEIEKKSGGGSGNNGSNAEPGELGSTVEVLMGTDASGNEIIKYGGTTYTYIPAVGNRNSGTGFYTPARTARQQVDDRKADDRRTQIRETETANWINFMRKAAVISRLNDPLSNDFDTNSFWNWLNENDANFGSLVVGIWEDSQLLRQVYEYDMVNPTDSLDRKFEPRTNPGYLPIQVTFTIHGVSGFKVGDMIHFKDLPHVYRNKIFTVMEISHTLDGDIWKTTIMAACRNMEIDGGEISLPPSPPPPPTPLPGTPGSNQDPQGNRQGQQTPPSPPSPGNRDFREPENYTPGTYWPPGQEPWNQ